MQNNKKNLDKLIITELIKEVQAGEIKRDTLKIEARYSFEGPY